VESKLEKFCDFSSVTFFGFVIMLTSLKWCHNKVFKFDFIIISLKNYNLAKLRNFSHQNRKLRGAGDGEFPALGEF